MKKCIMCGQPLTANNNNEIGPECQKKVGDLNDLTGDVDDTAPCNTVKVVHTSSDGGRFISFNDREYLVSKQGDIVAYKDDQGLSIVSDIRRGGMGDFNLFANSDYTNADEAYNTINTFDNSMYRPTMSLYGKNAFKLQDGRTEAFFVMSYGAVVASRSEDFKITLLPTWDRSSTTVGHIAKSLNTTAAELRKGIKKGEFRGSEIVIK
jgi:hypothetical protein